MTKLAIVYYSTYGTNHQMAEIAADAARAAGAEVRLLKAAETAPQTVIDGQPAWKEQAEKTAHIPEATAADMEWADAFLFSTPTRFGNAASQMRAFIDTLGGLWSQGKLAKPASVMTSTSSPHGGQETTTLSMFHTLIHFGAILVPPGYTDESIPKTGGNPYGYAHTQGAEFTDDVKAAIGAQTRRLLHVATKLSA